MTVRAMAEAMGMSLGKYSFYENQGAQTFKRQHLPLAFARKAAEVLSPHGVPVEEVMALAGLNAEEAAPAARSINARRHDIQIVTMQMALPSVAALTRMFQSLLALTESAQTRDEVAQILAERLSSGLAAIGPVVIEEETDEETDLDEPSAVPAKDHPSRGRQLRT